jgi:hypothetical protein
MTDDGLAVVAPAALSPRQLDQAERVYLGAFPPRLRVPFASLAACGPADLTLVAVAGVTPVGFAVVQRLADTGWTFLRYYCVAADRRRSGLGLRFWRLLRPALDRAGWPARIAFEVEDPQEAAGDPVEYQVRAGRIAFWQACGANLLPVSGYVMPDLTGLAAPEPMLLMAVDAPGAAGLPPGQVAGLVTAIYTCRYGLATDHPLVTAALASVAR